MTDDRERCERPVVLITGSTKGIGRAIADHFGGRGWRCVLNGRRLQDADADSGVDRTYVAADVADESDAARLVERAGEHWGRLDAVVNNAAFARRIRHRDLDAVDAELWDRILSTNLIAPFNIARAAAPWLRGAPDGNIVNVSSLAGSRASGSSIPYAASKAALNHLTELLAAALAPEIRVNAVAPGFIDNDRGDDRDAVRNFVIRRAPLKRPGTTDEVARACAFLASPGYLTGEVLTVDGGLHVR